MVCGGSPVSSLVTLPIVPNSGGDLWWFAVINVWWFVVVCGSLRWFAVVCLLVIKLPLVRRISDMLKTTCPHTCSLVQVLVHFVGPKLDALDRQN